MNKISLFKSDKWSAFYILAFISTTIAFSCFVIKDFSGPLSGLAGLGPEIGVNHDYVDVQEYKGFYFAKNLNFNPLPHLNLINNQVFYPYGINSVFNPWSIEGDSFYALLYRVFGPGPWLQIYYLFTVLLTAIGTFLLLKPGYGVARAGGAGFLVSFGNVYAVNKYAHHLPLSEAHWVTLGLITDFLIVKRIVLREHVSLRLILVRSCLLLLTLGHDLGYIAGFGLMSFTVSLLFVFVLLIHRYLKQEFRLDAFQKELKTYRRDVFTYLGQCLVLLCLNIIVAYLYLPLVIQIAVEASKFDVSEVDIYWVNPLRLLIPFIPGIEQLDSNFEKNI